MKKIKIVRIIARLNIGGPAIHAILLTEGLKEPFESLLISGNVEEGEGDMIYYAQEKKVAPIIIPQLRRSINPFNDLVAFLKIYRIIASERPDIVHTHTAKAGTLGRLGVVLHNFLHPKNKIKLAHTFHGHVFSGYFNRLSTGFFIFIERLLASQTSQIITVSNSVKNELLSLKICPADKIKVIPLGFELDKFLTVLPRRNASNLNIGIVGRLVPIKNHKLFLDAAKIILKDNPLFNIRFKIIGDGQLRKDLEDYVLSTGISSYVDFLGWQKDLAATYSNLDIVALTSINEGTPVSLIEAMASGRPVVATDAGGIKDLLGSDLMISPGGSAVRIMERGVLVFSQEPQDFSAAVGILLKDVTIRDKLVSAACEFVKVQFSKHRLIEDIGSLYKQILSCA